MSLNSRSEPYVMVAYGGVGMYTVMACIIMAYVVMAYVVMAYIVMASEPYVIVAYGMRWRLIEVRRQAPKIHF